MPAILEKLIRMSLREKLDYDPADDVKFRDAGFLKTPSHRRPDCQIPLDLMKELFVDLQESGLFSSAVPTEPNLAIEGEEWQNGVFTFMLF